MDIINKVKTVFIKYLILALFNDDVRYFIFCFFDLSLVSIFFDPRLSLLLTYLYFLLQYENIFS